MKRLGKYRSTWMMVGMIVAICLFMAQRPNRKQPTPADPGMNIVVTVNTQTGEVSNDTDPNGGVEPDDVQPELPDDKPDEEVQDPKDYVALSITKLEVMRLGLGTEVGNVGDWVIVLTGEGFFEAERPPVVHLGDSIVLRDVCVNETGKELYAVLPAGLAAEVPRRDVRYVAVQNPGGLNCHPDAWKRFAVEQAGFERALGNAPKVMLRVGTYFVELVR